MIFWITAITDVIQIEVSIKRVQQFLCHLAFLLSSENATLLYPNNIITEMNHAWLVISC